MPGFFLYGQLFIMNAAGILAHVYHAPQDHSLMKPMAFINALGAENVMKVSLYLTTF